MNQTIKTRIEQIGRGEVPEGYKKVKTGVIPEKWSFEKLGKYLVQYHEVTTQNNQYPVLTSSRRGIFLQSEYYNSEVASDDNTGYNIVPRGYFTYRHMSDDEIFHFNINTLVDNGIVSTLYPVFTTTDKINDYFLQTILNEGRDFHRYAVLQKQGGSRTYMYFEKLKALSLPIPPLEEQERIAEILGTQDKLITLQEKKIVEIQEFKKICLRKMFPAKGEQTPEWRFPEFTEPWEQCKLGALGQVTMCRRIFKEQTTTKGDIPFYKIGTFGGTADAFISRALFEEYKAKFPYPHNGAILISASGSIGRTVVYSGENEYFQDSNIVWLVHDERITDSFLKHLYSVIHWAGIEGSTIKRLYNDNILKTKIFLPPIAEQIKLSKFLDSIDNLITLHQRKLEEMKKYKKALMQLLLTGIVRTVDL